MFLYPEHFPVTATLDLALIMFNLVGYFVRYGTFEGGKYSIAWYRWSDGKVTQCGERFFIVVITLGTNDKEINLLVTTVRSSSNHLTATATTSTVVTTTCGCVNLGCRMFFFLFFFAS